jgi:class 3 adenylate cyclase
MSKQNLFEALQSTYSEMLKEAGDGGAKAASRRHYALSAGSTDFSAGADTGVLVNKSATAPPVLVVQGQFQELLRRPYGKTGISPAAIGHHPDFKHLLNTSNTEYCAITTMFMDMKGATTLGVLHEPPTVFYIKNTFLSLAIEIIKAFDGHVHRLQGDAVMAYFGGKNLPPEQGVIDATNCAMILMQIVKRSVIPSLNARYPDTPLGIRIGLDHGTEQDVLWGCYGYTNMGEVTATSLYVDLAAKLQQAAGANQIMLGETLRSQLDLHDQLLAVKRNMRDGRECEQPFVEPNHLDRAGKPIDYKQYLLKDDAFFAISPLVADSGNILPNADHGVRLSPLRIRATLHHRQGGTSQGQVISCGSLVPRERSIAFKVELPHGVQYPCTIRFRVENHGAHALKDAGSNRGSHPGIHKTVYNAEEFLSLPPNWETTAYRGLHYLIAELYRGEIVTHRGTLGVYVL